MIRNFAFFFFFIILRSCAYLYSWNLWKDRRQFVNPLLRKKSQTDMYISNLVILGIPRKLLK